MNLREKLLALAADWTYRRDPEQGLLEGNHKLALAAARMALEDAARRLDNIPYQRDAHPAELLRRLRDVLE